MLIGEIILFVVFIILSAFFSGTEIALMSLSNHKVISLEKEKKIGSKFLKKIKKENDRLLITILIGNNLVNVGAASLATATSIELAENFGFPGNYGIGIATGMVTLILLLFGEITPKTICSKYNEKISLLVAPIYFYLIKILLPISIFIEIFVKVIGKLFGGNIHPKMSTEELEAFIDMSHEKGAVEAEEHKKIKSILDLGETLAESVMTPRVQMDAININSTVDQLCDFLLTRSHSRIPVYKDTIDNIDYVITFKEAFKLKESGRGNKKLSELMLDKIIKVPLTQPVDKIFEILQKSRKHIALVLDEHGGVEGIITLEDIIEEVFGDIKDETDREGIYLSKLKDGKIQADGNVIINDILSELKIDDIEDIGLGEEFLGENLSYIITSRLERFPENGEILELLGKNIGIKLNVKQINGGKIGQIIIQKLN